jgi:hypothetical protein
MLQDGLGRKLSFGWQHSDVSRPEGKYRVQVVHVSENEVQIFELAGPA